MKLTKLTDSTDIKPKRVIYGGTLYHGEEFWLNRQLFGNSPNSFVRDQRKAKGTWTNEAFREALRDRTKRSRGRLSVSTNELSLIRGTIGESIKDVGIYPVKVVVDTTDGKSEEWLVTE
jgi:hypothetical protein